MDVAAISAIFFGVVVIAALAWLALRGLMLWRAIKAAKRLADTRLAVLSAESERLSAAQAQMPRRQAELQGAIAGVQARVAVAGMLAAYAGQAVKALRTPLKYLGG